MWTVLIGTLFCVSTISGQKNVTHAINKRSVPTTPCDDSREGNSIYNPLQTDTVWICKSGKWTPFKLTLSLGSTQDVPGSSCKEILQSHTSNCYQTPTDGLYWITLTDQCSKLQQTIQVWCDMTTCGGGWTLVWKHSYMEVRPLTTDMYYFSNHYRPCSDINSGWCNVPFKSRFNATQMMIVAYHNKRLVYAYQGRYNGNMDTDWTGGILLDHRKCVDHCTKSNGVRPAPSSHGNLDSRLLGMAFDKHSPDNYYISCDTFYRNFDNPVECRWANCGLPTSISATSGGDPKQMTVAIYVR